jgi:hypothetical protein
MTQERSVAFPGKGGNNIMKNHKQIILIGIVSLCAFTIHAAAFPIVTFPLKPSPESGPYEDEKFLELANMTIYSLSNQTIPNGTALGNLQTTQQKLSRMNISPELHPTATYINDYLYYASKAGAEYSDALSLATSIYSPVYRNEGLLGEAKTYQAASQTIWNRIKDLYPGVIPYTISFPVTSTSSTEYDVYSREYNPFLEQTQ